MKGIKYFHIIHFYEWEQDRGSVMEVYVLGGKAVTLGWCQRAGTHAGRTAAICGHSATDEHTVYGQSCRMAARQGAGHLGVLTVSTVAMDAEDRELRCVIPNIHSGPGACKQLWHATYSLEAEAVPGITLISALFCFASWDRVGWQR